MGLRVLARWLGGLWAGQIACVGGLVAPMAFAVLARPDAGRFVGRLFEVDAYLALGVGLLLVLMERRFGREDAEAGRGSAFTTNMMLVLGAMFCVVFGYFGLQPLMADARAGLGGLSFRTLHTVSAAFFTGKGLIVAILAWRYAGQARS
jgi:hypothetical protein